MSVGMLGIAGWYYYLGLPEWSWILALVLALILFPIGNKMNKALFVLHHEKGTRQWDLACVSFAALAEEMNHETYRFLVHEILPADDVQRAMDKYRKYPGEAEAIGISVRGSPTAEESDDGIATEVRRRSLRSPFDSEADG